MCKLVSTFRHDVSCLSVHTLFIHVCMFRAQPHMPVTLLIFAGKLKLLIVLLFLENSALSLMVRDIWVKAVLAEVECSSDADSVIHFHLYK